LIERYSDHAANERTFLAWVRTGIALMAFGFVVEKFDLFLAIAAGTNGTWRPSLLGQIVSNLAGLLLILLGGGMLVLSAIRFRKIALDIDAADIRPGTGDRMDMALVGLLVILGATLFVYLTYTVVSRL
jgi:putative membrane protein